MKQIRIEVTHANGRVDNLNVEVERVLIGSGAHCDVRLGVDQGQLEHVVLHVTPTGIVAQALAQNPPVTVDGVPFTQTSLTTEQTLILSQTRIRAGIVEVGVARGKTGSKSSLNPGVLLLFVLALGFGAYTFFGTEDPASVGKKMPSDYPELFTDPPSACPKRSAEEAVTLAKDAQSRAEAKRERRPFYMKDGVDSVPLFELAAVCYQTAGMQDIARELRGTADILRREINDDYKTHRVRLERALKEPKDPALAKNEIRTLISITQGREAAKASKYFSWLGEQEKRLRLTTGKTGK